MTNPTTAVLNLNPFTMGRRQAGPERPPIMAYRKNRHPILKDKPPGWHPEAVGVVKGYPPSQEAYDALVGRLKANRERARDAGRLTCVGVPKGWAGEKHELADIRSEAAQSAGRLARYLPGYDDWDSRAKLAIEELCAVALDISQPIAIRLDAMKTVLTYTQPKPVQQSIGAFGGPDAQLSWLSALATEALVKEARKGKRPV